MCIEIEIITNKKIIVYVKFLKKLSKQVNMNDLQSIAITTMDGQNVIKIMEYINIEWLVQTEEHEVFNWLQNCYLRKESYIYKTDKLVLQILCKKQTLQTQQKIIKIRKLHTI